jgi:hypothetical protein
VFLEGKGGKIAANLSAINCPTGADATYA